MNLFIILMLTHYDEAKNDGKLLAHFPQLTYTLAKVHSRAGE